MKNPWLGLPSSPPYVLPADREPVQEHNGHSGCNKKPNGKFNLNLLPVPYVGSPNAPVVCLTLNPGNHPDDAKINADPVYRRLNQDNLCHKAGYYYLSKKLPECPGKRYAIRQFKELLSDLPLDAVYRGIFVAQYCPYHSVEYVDTKILLPSQQYTFSIVEQAIRRNALIVLLRSRKLWHAAVPELVTYQNYFECTNPRSPTVSRRSLPMGYRQVLQKLS